jgi:hypothetical protein
VVENWEGATDVPLEMHQENRYEQMQTRWREGEREKERKIQIYHISHTELAA